MPGHRVKRGGPPNGLYKPYEKGHSLSVIHGAGTPRLVDPVAETFLEELRESQPDYLGDPSFKWALWGWAQAEARSLLFDTWMSRLPEEERYHATGAQRPPIDRAADLSAQAMAHRSRLGLDPVSRVKIGKALSSKGVDLAKLAEMAQRNGWNAGGEG